MPSSLSLIAFRKQLRHNPYIFAKNTGGRAPYTKGLEIFNLVDLLYNAGFALEGGSFAVPGCLLFYGDTKLIGEKGNISQDTSVLPLTKLYLFLTDTTEAILSP